MEAASESLEERRDQVVECRALAGRHDDLGGQARQETGSYLLRQLVIVDLDRPGEIRLLRPLVDQAIARDHRQRPEDGGRAARLEGRELDLGAQAGMDGLKVVRRELDA